MAYDLNELHERIDLCRTKGAALNEEIVKVAGQSIKHWLTVFGPGAGAILAKMTAVPTVALRSEIGMIVNEQRAILDALACALANRNGANHTNDVYFPITRDKAGFDELGRRKIRKLSQQDQDIIEALLPWGTEDGGHPYLFQLHEVDRVRKHQKLLRWATIGGAFATSSGHIGMMQSAQVAFQEIGKEERLAFFSNATCDIGVRFGLVYAEPTAVDGHNVAACLHAFNDTVEAVVTAFD